MLQLFCVALVVGLAVVAATALVTFTVIASVVDAFGVVAVVVVDASCCCCCCFWCCW